MHPATIAKNLFALGALTLTVACATANVSVVKAPSQPVRRLTLSFAPGPDAQKITDEQQSRLRTVLTSALTSAGINVVSASEPGVPKLDGVIERYNPGIRALRYFVGFGAGRATFASSWRVMDPSGGVIGECRVTGSVAMGAFGGSYDEVLDKVGAQLRGCVGA
jgi:hypothetical protein